MAGGKVVPIRRAEAERLPEGQILSPAESAALDTRINRFRQASADGAVLLSHRIIDFETRYRVLRGVGRNIVYVLLGFQSWAKRWWESRYMAPYEREIKEAEAAGDPERKRLALVSRSEGLKERAEYLEKRPKRFRSHAKTLACYAGIVVGAVLGLALIVQVSGAGAFADVIVGVVEAIAWSVRVIVWAWTFIMIAIPVGIVLLARREGKKRGKEPPMWLATTIEAERDVEITEDTVTQALKGLRIPAINQHLKKAPLQFIITCRESGRGTYCAIRLPGVPAARIEARRSDLASGLYRATTEVWPSTGDEAGILVLWIADKGALAEGAGAYPLLNEGAVDVFKGIPTGRLLRGEPVLIPVMGRNTICGGIPGQGKSNEARVFMAGAALDPTAELRICVPDSNFDFEAFRKRCSRYVMGAEDEKIGEIRDVLRELYADVQHRGKLLVLHREQEVTRALASKNIGLHPLFFLLEEAHIAFDHERYGKEIRRLVTNIVRLGRKRGIHMFISTQAPTKDSIPRDVTRNCSNGIAFAVSDHWANDALLGQGAYRGGVRATELIVGTDIGTAVTKGLTKERSAIVQMYRLDVSQGRDDVTPIIERAMAIIAERGAVPGTDGASLEVELRDLLDDLATVLGSRKVPIADVPPMLRKLAPDYPGYTHLDGVELREILWNEYNIKVPSTGNKYPLDPLVVREALARQSTADLDDESQWDDEESDELAGVDA